MSQEHNQDDEPIEWRDSEGNGLSITEMDDLAHRMYNNPERLEHEALEAERTRRYLEWGKYLVDNTVVSDWDLS